MDTLEHPTMSNTKKEILEAYSELLKRKQETETKHPKEEKAEKQKLQTIKSASALSAEGIVTGLASIKLDISTSIDKIEGTLLDEFQKLKNLQEAIKIETENLEDMYAIRSNADSLAVLISVNKEKKAAFEQEMEEKRLALERNIEQKKQDWEKTQKERDVRWKEEDADRAKALKREEEEYKYNLTTTRKKEENIYLIKKEMQERELEEKRIAFEKEWTERGNAIAQKEEEFEQLKKEVANFTQILEKEINSAKSILEKEITTKYEYEKQLYEREAKGEIKLLQQTVSSLKQKIEEQETLISSLNEKTSLAGDQVQTIALKALETATTIRYNQSQGEQRKDPSATS